MITLPDPQPVINAVLAGLAFALFAIGYVVTRVLLNETNSTKEPAATAEPDFPWWMHV